MNVSVVALLTSAALAAAASCAPKPATPPPTATSSSVPNPPALNRAAASNVPVPQRGTTEPSPVPTTREAAGGFLGVGVVPIQAAGPGGHVSGVAIFEILDGSPASHSRLEVGDIIHEVNGRAIPATESATKAFQDAILACSAGQTVTLGIVTAGPDREPRNCTVDVQLGKRPEGTPRELIPLPNSAPEQAAARMSRRGFKLASTSGNPGVKGSKVWTRTDTEVVIYYVNGKVLYAMTVTPARSH